MSLKLGGSASKTKSSMDTTTTPIIPDWISNGAEGLWSAGSKVASGDPQSFVAPANPLQNTAAANAANMTGNWWDFDKAAQTAGDLTSAAAPRTSGVTADGYLDRYMTPYQKDVVSSTLADFDHNAGQTRAQQTLDLAKAGALGGSGAQIGQAQTAGQLARARAATESGVLSAGFNTALTAAQQDAQRQQGTNDLNAQLGMQSQAQRLAAARALGDIGAQDTATRAQVVNTQAGEGAAQRAIAEEQAQAPLALQSWLQQYFSGLPLDMFAGQHQVGTGKGTTLGFTASAQQK